MHKESFISNTCVLTRLSNKMRKKKAAKGNFSYIVPSAVCALWKERSRIFILQLIK